MEMEKSIIYYFEILRTILTFILLNLQNEISGAQ